MKDINLMLTIIKRSDEAEFTAFYEKFKLPAVFSARADGTTNSKTLSLLGIERTEKTVLMSVVSGDTAKKMMKGLARELFIDMPDRGISVACPLASVGGASALSALTQGTINEKDGNDMNTPRELIVVIANRNTSDLVMDAAREGGAFGGTVVHAMGTAGVGTEKFFNLSLAQEREIIFIVTKGEDRNAIMRSIMQKAGVGTEAGALTFSMPITHTAGFASLDADETEE